MRLQILLVIFFGILPLVLLSAPGASGVGGKTAAGHAVSEFPKDIMKLDETNAEYFVAQTLERSRALQSAAVLQRLLMLKQQESKDSIAELKEKYDILPNGDYMWEASDRTIYELTGEKNWRGEPKRLKFRKFSTDEEAKPAVAAMAKRLQLAQQVLVLTSLVTEQVDLANAADKALRKKFKLAEDGNYTFDVPKRTIVQTGVKESVAKKEAK